MMCADIFTKMFSDAVKWQHACDLIGIVLPTRIDEALMAEVCQDKSTEVLIRGAPSDGDSNELNLAVNFSHACKAQKSEWRWHTEIK